MAPRTPTTTSPKVKVKHVTAKVITQPLQKKTCGNEESEEYCYATKR